MQLDENNYKEQINAFTLKDWQPLIELIPEIESTLKFNDSYIVSKFHEVAYNLPIIISFDWGDWHEGQEIVKNEGFDLNAIDVPTKCKLITAIVRNDRFCEGALNSAFESGLILRILKSIEKQVTNVN